MKRPMLVSGITMIFTLALLIFFESGAVVVPLVAALVLFLCVLFRKSIKKYIIIPTICIVALTTLLSFFLYNSSNISPLLQHHKTTQTVSGKVISTPKYASNYVLFNLKAEKIGNCDVDTNIHIILSNYSDEKVALYDYIVIEDSYITVPTDEYGNYDFIEISDNILLSAHCNNFEKMWDCEKTPYYYCLRFKEIISENITAYMTKNNGALLKGMLFGEKAELDYSTTVNFRNCGISHLLAVSGLHTSLWCGLLIAILSIFKIPKKARNAICLIFLVLFCIISGFTPSVVRASLMTALSLIAPFYKRTSDSINALGLAVVIILLFNPYTLFSISFQLSVAATLGVLIAGMFTSKIQHFVKKLPVKKLRSIIASLLTSLLISLMAGVFTMPVSVYYFEVFSLASPVSNLLCVQLAFYGMITGAISVALSFIKLSFVKEICLLLFRITEFLLDLVKELAEFVSDFHYCTIPIHREYLHMGLIVAFIFLCIGYIIYKSTKSNIAIKLTALICVICCIVSVIFPLTVPSHRNTITIAKCEGGVQLIIRSGTDYAYIENTTAEIADGTFDALPKATCEQLKYYIPTYLSSNSINNLSVVSFQYKPEEIILPRNVRQTALKKPVSIPENAVVDNGGFFTLSDEITFEIVDTNSIKYAIIRGGDKTAFIHLYGDTDFSKYVSTENCHIAVYNGKIPENIPVNTETVIICINDYDPVKIETLSYQCDEILTTAKHGSMQIYLD